MTGVECHQCGCIWSCHGVFHAQALLSGVVSSPASQCHSQLESGLHLEYFGFLAVLLHFQPKLGLPNCSRI